MYVDMHSHSVASDDSRATVEQYLRWIQVLRRRGHTLDAIVLTEHRQYDKDADYSSLAREHGVLVLRGAELDTRYGHFLVYGVNDSLLNAVDFSDINIDPVELMEETRQQGAIAIPAHPGRPGIGLSEFMDNGIDLPGVQIVETLNGGSRKGENERALQLAKQRGYKEVGGSDAHLVSSIGTCLTRFSVRIRNEQELVEALLCTDYAPVRLEDSLSADGAEGGAP